jgi:6-phospho-3-hexuloisomerase
MAESKKKKKTRPDLFEILRARLEGIATLLDDMDEPQSEELIRMLLQAERIFVTGKGRSGKIADSFAVRLMQMGFDVHVPGESTCPRIKRGDLMVALSCSGTTITTVQIASISRKARAKVAVITAVPDSPLAKLGHLTVLVPTTGADVKKRYRYVLGSYNNTLFEEAMLLYFDAMVYSMLQREGIPKARLRERHTNLE